jgi:hypothetical protein
MIPTIIPTACKAIPTATRGCVISQATSSAGIRLPEPDRLVARTLDFCSDRSRVADDLVKYVDRSEPIEAKGAVVVSVGCLSGYGVYRLQKYPAREVAGPSNWRKLLRLPLGADRF